MALIKTDKTYKKQI